MPLTDRFRSHILILLANIIFGINTPLSKYMLSGHITSGSLIILRMFFGCLLFWTLSLFFPKEKVTPKDLFVLFLCSLLGIVLNQGLYVYGLSITSSLDASILVTATPIFVMFLAYAILKEMLSKIKIFGVIWGAIGAIWLALSANIDGNMSASLTGNFAVLSASLLYSIYFVYSKKLSQKFTAITIMKWMFLFSVIVTMPLFYDDFIDSPLFNPETTWADIGAIGYIIFFATFLGYLLVPMALRHMRPTTVSMYNYVQPLVAAMIAILFLGDTFTLSKILSSIMILSGVYLVTISPRRPKVE